MADLKANLLLMAHSTVRQSFYFLASGECRFWKVRALQPGHKQNANGETKMQLLLLETWERCQLFDSWMLESFGLPDGYI